LDSELKQARQSGDIEAIQGILAKLTRLAQIQFGTVNRL